MSFSLVRKHLSQMGRLRPRSSLERSYIPMAGPPRFPMSTAQRLILGVGSLGVMMIIPYWCLFNLRRWSRMHLGLPPEEEEKEEPPPPEAQEETDKDKDKKDKKEKDKKEDKKEEKKK